MIDIALLVLLLLCVMGLALSDGWVYVPMIWMFCSILVLRRIR